MSISTKERRDDIIYFLLNKVKHTENQPQTVSFSKDDFEDAEGLLMYFQLKQVQQLINELSRRFPGATFVFDVVGGITKGQTAKFLASIGAPLQWLVKNESDVTKMKLTLVEAKSLGTRILSLPRSHWHISLDTLG